MEIVVTGRHTQVKQKFRDVVESKMNRVTAIAPDAQRAQIVLTHEGNPRQADTAKRVEITVIAGSTVVRAEASSTDEFSALDMALDKLTLRLRRTRDRRKDHRRGYINPTPVDLGAVAPPEPEEEAEPASVPHSGVRSSGFENDSELRALFERTYGPVRDRGFEALQQSRKKAETLEQLYVTRIRQDDYLLVDGYNIIFAWDELKAIAAEDVNAARERLVNIMSNYQGVRRCHLILVFDAYKVKGGTGSVEKRHGIHIVYTKEAETADMYIEQASYDLSRRHRVRVATSDGMEQMIILGHGAERMSATELKWEVEQADEHLHGIIQNLQP